MRRGIFQLIFFLVLLLPIITVGCISFPTSTTTPSTTTTTTPATTPATGTTVPATTPQVPVIQAWLTPTGITPKGTAELHWNVTGASAVTIDQGIGSVAPSGVRAVSPNVTTTYTITAYYAGGTVTNAVTLAVAPAGPGPSTTPPPGAKDWLGSTYTREYHYPGCSVAQHIPLPSRIWFDTTMQAQAAGYHPCPVCKPPR